MREEKDGKKREKGILKGKMNGEFHLVPNCCQGGNITSLLDLIPTTAPMALGILKSQSLQSHTEK